MLSLITTPRGSLGTPRFADVSTPTLHTQYVPLKLLPCFPWGREWWYFSKMYLTRSHPHAGRVGGRVGILRGNPNFK